MPMFLAHQKSGSRFTALKSSDLSRKAPLLTFPLLTATLSKWSINLFSSFTNLWLHFSAFLCALGASTAHSIQTISVPLGRYGDVGSMSRNRIYFSLILVLILLLASLFPTAKAVGLGLTHQQHSSAQHRLQSSPFYDSERSGADSVPPVDDSTIKIRTRDSTPVLQPRQLGGPAIDPFLYSAPPVDSGPQRPAYVPVLVPGSYYYPVYSSPWGYPETRIVGTYSQYNSVPRRTSQTNRRKSGNKKRRDKFKGEKCPKICDTCVRIQDNRGKIKAELISLRSDKLHREKLTFATSSIRHKQSNFHYHWAQVNEGSLSVKLLDITISMFAGLRRSILFQVKNDFL